MPEPTRDEPDRWAPFAGAELEDDDEREAGSALRLTNDPDLLLAIVLSCAVFAVALSALLVVSAAIVGGGYVP